MSNGVPSLTFVCGSWFMRCDDEIRESRLRRMAERQGLILMASRRREAPTGGYELYWLATIAEGGSNWRGRLLVSPDAGMTIDGVEEYLTCGITRTAVIAYLTRSYGPIFVEELIKHLPQLSAETPNVMQE
jgi:hypothetical protein